MANPSLQIGNSNWAIKEDNLLGYSTAGTRFLPQPITMTRGSAGTRVNSSGLVETVELLGSDLVTNGDFATDTDWTKGTGTTISGGLANLDGSAGAFVSALYQDIPLISGKTYRITFNISNFVSGSLRIRFDQSFTAIGNMTQDGFYEFTKVAASNDDRINFVTNAINTICSIDNVSVKESTKNNLARVDYDGTASSLLVEPERTNLITYSSDASQWINDYSVTITTDSETSPNGLVDADKIEFTQDGSLRPNNSQLTFVNDYNYSIFVKKGNSRYITLQANFFTTNSTIGFDLDTATAQSGGIIENYGNDWFRLSITKNVTGDADRTGAFYIYSPNTLGSASSVAGNYLYVWGAQVEEGSYATSYIPTSGSTVTRVADQYTKTGISNLINSEEGVLFVEMASLANDGTYKGISLSDGSTSNVVRFYTNPTENQLSIRVTVAGVHQFNVVYTLTDLTTYNKVALKYKANDFAFWVNGVEVKSYIGGTTFTSNTLNKLALSNGAGSDDFFGKVKQLQVFKTSLSDTQLATLTT